MVTLGIKEKNRFVRIKLGNSETGHKGFYAPIKTINVPKLSVKQVYDIIVKAINKRIK